MKTEFPYADAKLITFQERLIAPALVVGCHTDYGSSRISFNGNELDRHAAGRPAVSHIEYVCRQASHTQSERERAT